MAMAMSMVASTRGLALMPAYAKNSAHDSPHKSQAASDGRCGYTRQQDALCRYRTRPIVVAMDTSTGQQIGAVEVGARPWGIAPSPDGHYLFTANGPSNDVSIVDARTMTLSCAACLRARARGESAS